MEVNMAKTIYLVSFRIYYRKKCLVIIVLYNYFLLILKLNKITYIGYT